MGCRSGDKVLKMLISLASTILQLIWLKRFIKMNVWKIIVSKMSLSVGVLSKFLFFSNIRLNDLSKNMNCPKYIRIIMTKI